MNDPVIPRTNIIGVKRQDGWPILVHDDGDGIAYTLPLETEMELYGHLYPDGPGSWPHHDSCPAGIPIFLPEVDYNHINWLPIKQAFVAILPWLVIAFFAWLALKID